MAAFRLTALSQCLVKALRRWPTDPHRNRSALERELAACRPSIGGKRRTSKCLPVVLQRKIRPPIWGTGPIACESPRRQAPLMPLLLAAGTFVHEFILHRCEPARDLTNNRFAPIPSAPDPLPRHAEPASPQSANTRANARPSPHPNDPHGPSSSSPQIARRHHPNARPQPRRRSLSHP